MAELENISQGPGQLLTEARKKIGLTQADVGRLLNLSLATIATLESDQFNNDIPDAFLRGYLRTYARAVNQDEDEVIDLYTQITGMTTVKNYYVPSDDIKPVRSQIGGHMLWFKLLSMAVVITIIVLGWLAYKSNEENKKVSQNNVIDSTKDSLATVPIKKVSTDLEVNSADKSKVENSESELTQTQQPTVLPLDTAQSQQEPIVQEQGFLDSDIDPSMAELEFSFLEDCWIKVVDINDEILAVGLKSSGRRFSVQGATPITVILGKPRAVSLQYNNQSIDLSIYPAGQTARFTLGE